MTKTRFKTYNGYVFDKWIFRISILLIILFFGIIILVNGYQFKYYYSCDSPLGCDLIGMKEFCHEPSSIENIKYHGRYEWLQSCGLCDGGTVPNGFTCGENTGFLQGSESVIAIFIILGAFGFNHFKHNKNYKFMEEI